MPKEEVKVKEPNVVETMAKANNMIENTEAHPDEIVSTPVVKDFPKVREAKKKKEIADKDKPILKWLAYITGGVDSAFLIANHMQPVDFDNSYKLEITGACLKLSGDANKDQVAACKYICDKLGAKFVALDADSSKAEDVYDPNVYGLKLFEYAEANNIQRISLNFNNDEINMLPTCNHSIINGLNQQCQESGSQIRFHAPISGQSKGIIIKSVHDILGLDLKKLNYSSIKNEDVDKARAYIRIVGFATAGVGEDPQRAKYEKLLG